MRKKVPGGAVGTVVFTYRAPLAFGKVRPPPPPVRRTCLGLLESHGFLCHRCHVLLPWQTVRLQTSGHPVHSLDAMGIHVRRDSWVSVMYAEELNSGKSSVTLQRTDRHGSMGQKS